MKNDKIIGYVVTRREADKRKLEKVIKNNVDTVKNENEVEKEKLEKNENINVTMNFTDTITDRKINNTTGDIVLEKDNTKLDSSDSLNVKPISNQAMLWHMSNSAVLLIFELLFDIFRYTHYKELCTGYSS